MFLNNTFFNTISKQFALCQLVNMDQKMMIYACSSSLLEHKHVC